MLFLSTEFLLIFMGMKPKVVMQVERGFSVFQDLRLAKSVNDT